MPSPVIEARGLVHRFRRSAPPALDRVSFDVGQGEIFGLLGADGAGKSTLLRILAGLIPPMEGYVRIGGHDVVTDRRHLRDVVGYLGQSPPMPRDRTVTSYLMDWARIEGMSGAERSDRLGVLLEALGLGDVAAEKVIDCTTFAQRRLFLGMALLSDPKILLLDEPMAGLIPADRGAFLELIRTVSAGKTTILATTTLANAQPICTRIMTLIEGKASKVYDTEVILRAVGEAHHARVFVDVGTPFDTVGPVLRSIPGVLDIQETAPVVTMFVEPGVFHLDELRRVLAEHGMEPRSVKETDIVLGDVIRTLSRREAT